MVEKRIDDELVLLEYWLVLWRRRWLIAGLFVVSVVATMLISFQLPKIYESTATILPQLESGSSGGLAALMGGQGSIGMAEGLGISLPGRPATPTDVFVAMLKSRTMAEALVEEFDLKTRYEVETGQAAREALGAATTIQVTEEQVIQVTVEDEDPRMAAEMANAYVDHLNRLNQTMNLSKAAQDRSFIERRLVQTEARLASAEESLKEFQQQHKTVAVEQQSNAMIEAAAQIQAQIMAQEVKLESLKSYLSPNNPELTWVRSSIDELRKQLHLLESGEDGKGMLPGDHLHPAMVTVPELALEYGRHMRELKVQESLYKLLKSEYEQAKLAEAHDMPMVQVLDVAVPAEKKSKPSIRTNMMIAGALSVIVGILLAFFLDFLKRMRQLHASRETTA